MRSGACIILACVASWLVLWAERLAPTREEREEIRRIFSQFSRGGPGLDS